jgi:peptidoglycan/xylan/chitin deacetylase (PgdA/CDA1 family)
LTVDLCAIQNVPSRYDGAYFKTLDEAKIPYTVYPSGKWMREHPEEMKGFMRNPNIQIGLHGDTHQALTLVTDPATVKQEFDKPLGEYQKLLAEMKREGGGKALRTDGTSVPDKLTSVREPWGMNSQMAMDEAKAHGMTIAHWTYAADGKGQVTPTMDKIARQKESGAIVLTHGNMNTKHDTGDVLQGIRQAQAAGYQFTTVDGLLKTSGAVPQRTVGNANDAIHEKITPNDILTADCHNRGGGSGCRASVGGETAEQKQEVLARYRNNLPKPQ